MNSKYLLFAFVIILCNCSPSEKSDKNKIIGSWKVSELSNIDNKNLAMNEQASSTLGSESKTKKLVLHFFPDSSYTILEDRQVKLGKWSYLNEKEIKYGNHRLTIEKFNQEESSKSLTVNMLNEDGTIASELTLIDEVEKIKDYKQDPFYPNNNKWRQRPLKKETNAEISKRLSNYILHNAYVLKAAYDRNETSISFKHSKGLIKIYQGGIGVVKENKVNKSWINCFYDEDDAMKAYYLYSSYLGKTGVYRAKSTGDWVKDDYEILMTLYYQIQKKEKESEEVFEK